MSLGGLPHMSQAMTTVNLKAPCYRMIAKLAMLLELLLIAIRSPQQRPVWYQTPVLPAPLYEALSRLKVMQYIS